METRFVDTHSTEWMEARALRYEAFFKEHGLEPAVMDDEHEADAVHLVASSEGHVVGCGRLAQPAPGAFQISQMVVSPGHQGQGLGRKLLECLIRRAVDAGAASIELRARLPAAAFYEKLGFERFGEVSPSEKTGVPHVRMRLRVSGPTIT